MDIFTLDIGNSHFQIMHFGASRTQQSSVAELRNYVSNPSAQFILSSVISDTILQERFPELAQILWHPDHAARFIWTQKLFYNNQFLNMPVQYSATLGMDRLVQSFHIFQALTKNSSLIPTALLIDAGTMLTIDIIHAQQGFLGGYIALGAYTYCQSMAQFGQQLPREDYLWQQLSSSFKVSATLALPQNTAAAIVQNYWSQLLGLLRQIDKKFSVQKIFISGGHAHLLEQFLQELQKNSDVFTTILTLHKDQDFIHHALYDICLKLAQERT